MPEGMMSSGPHPARPADCLVTLIVPVLNEAEAIPLFMAAIDRVLGNEPLRLEILFVDDGSTDATPAILAALAQQDPRIRALSLSRNFGKEAAMSAGLDHATGDVVIPIDVDLQDPPELIPTFIARWREGYDVVYGVRADRRSDGWLKRASAGLFYRCFNAITHTRIPADTGDYRLMDRRVVEVLCRLTERTRFMKGLFAWVGFRSIGIPFERAGRAAGSSKWKGWQLWNFALEGMTSFSTAPLRVWTYLGGMIAGLAFLYAAIIIVKTLIFGIDMPGYPSLMAVVLFLGGCQLLSLGVIGEYLGRLFLESKQRPLYIVSAEHAAPQPKTNWPRAA
jgi:glycosyltransferase involved in cell wall biosynthesis